MSTPLSLNPNAEVQHPSHDKPLMHKPTKKPSKNSIQLAEATKEKRKIAKPTFTKQKTEVWKDSTRVMTCLFGYKDKK